MATGSVTVYSSKSKLSKPPRYGPSGKASISLTENGVENCGGDVDDVEHDDEEILAAAVTNCDCGTLCGWVSGPIY